jgi:hypothetical protein
LITVSFSKRLELLQNIKIGNKFPEDSRSLRCCKNDSDKKFLKALQGLRVDCINNFDKIYLETLEAPGVAVKNNFDAIFLKAIEGAGVAAQTILIQVF